MAVLADVYLTSINKALGVFPYNHFPIYLRYLQEFGEITPVFIRLESPYVGILEFLIGSEVGELVVVRVVRWISGPLAA
jgi:hypothetical protein